MKIAVYGYHHAHLDMFLDEAAALGHELVGVCDPGNPLAAALAEARGVPLVGVDELVALRPDIVASSAINCEKIDVVEFCAEHGFHVMLDKPAVTNREDLERLRAVVRAGRIEVGLMLTERFSPEVQALYRLIQEGRLGELRQLSFDKPHKLRAGTREAWHFDTAQNGGVVVDLLCHDIDLLLWFTGSEIVDIEGFVSVGGHAAYPEFTDSAVLVTRSANGVLAHLMANWWEAEAYPVWGRGRIICTGTEGTVEIMTTGEPLFDEPPYLYLCTHDSPPEKLVGVEPEMTLAEDFVARVEGRDVEPLIDHDVVLRVSELALAAADAAKVVRR